MAQDGTNTIKRFDRMVIGKSWEDTPWGGLRVPANISKIGVLAYPEIGTYEFRDENSQFDPKSVATTNSCPISVTHSDGLIDPDNYKQRNVGNVEANSAKRDDIFLSTFLIINDADTINKVKSGELTELSAGYTCEVVESDGEYQGIAYNRIQKNVVYNHIALLPPGTGRAGPDVSIRYDSKDGDKMDEPVKEDPVEKKDQEEMAEIEIEGEKMQCQKKIADYINSLLAQINAKTDACGTEEKKMDSALTTEQLVDQRVELFLQAQNLGVPVAKTDSNTEIMSKIVRSKAPDIKLDSADIRGAFALICHNHVKAASSRADVADLQKRLDSTKTEEEQYDPRAEMIKRNRGEK